MRSRTAILAIILAGLSGAAVQPAAAQRRPVAQQRRDSIRLTFIDRGTRLIYADDEEQSGCNAARIPKDGTDRISGWVWLPIHALIGVGDTLVRETNVPICSYKEKNGSSEMCGMRLTGRMRVQVNFEEAEDEDHGLHLRVHWRATDSSTAKVDPGTCAETRNEQRDGDLTGAMAAEYRQAYAVKDLPSLSLRSGDMIFPIKQRGWLKAPYPLKGDKGADHFEIEISRR